MTRGERRRGQRPGGKEKPSKTGHHQNLFRPQQVHFRTLFRPIPKRSQVTPPHSVVHRGNGGVHLFPVMQAKAPSRRRKLVDLFPSTNYRGHIDVVRDGHVLGWAQDGSQARRRLVVEIYAGGVLLGTVRANLFRQDLVAAGIGDGKSAFSFALPSPAPDRGTLAARVAGTHYWLVDEGSADKSEDHSLDEPISPDWSHAIADATAFRREQQALAHTWTFLGLAADVQKDGDWFRALLATREVFVQRFGNELRGFENICPHRSYPLRHGDRGNGSIVCGFHHWQFNSDGLAIGIPHCRQLYGKLPHEMDARLAPIEVATCGALVFGRFPSAHTKESLQDFLAEGFPILAALSRMTEKPLTVVEKINANWKLYVHITLDDYHAPAIHSATVRASGGVLNPSKITYRQFGAHSCFLLTSDTKAFDRMVAGCRDGSYGASHYSIFQIFPNLVVSLSCADGDNWHCYLQQFIPQAHDRSLLRAFIYPSPLSAYRSRRARLARLLTDPIRKRLVVLGFRLVSREDRDACERLQEVHRNGTVPPLSGLERRIAWFEKAYRDAINTDR
jgi:phenylpropionate dioxygenase-like ring-hydroxylating dioxygenase large terminal subunit